MAWPYPVALLAVLLAQVLPCFAGNLAMRAPSAHCHDAGDAHPAAGPAAAVPGCKHCLWLAAPPPTERSSLSDAGSPVPDAAMLPVMALPRVPVAIARIDNAHPPPVPPLRSTLRHRVLLI